MLRILRTGDFISSKAFTPLEKDINNTKNNSLTGFTLMELMIAALILSLAIVGLLGSYISCMQLTEIMRNTSIAMNAVQAKAEEIVRQSQQPITELHNFNTLKVDYDLVSFTPLRLNGIGVSYVDDTNPDLLKITVSLSWRQSRGMVIGEDKNLNGQWDSGEDTLIANNILDSPAEIVTYIAKR